MALRPFGCLARGRRGSVLPVRSGGLLRGLCDGLAALSVALFPRGREPRFLTLVASITCREG